VKRLRVPTRRAARAARASLPRICNADLHSTLRVAFLAPSARTGSCVKPRVVTASLRRWALPGPPPTVLGRRVTWLPSRVPVRRRGVLYLDLHNPDVSSHHAAVCSGRFVPDIKASARTAPALRWYHPYYGAARDKTHGLRGGVLRGQRLRVEHLLLLARSYRPCWHRGSSGVLLWINLSGCIAPAFLRRVLPSPLARISGRCVFDASPVRVTMLRTRTLARAGQRAFCSSSGDAACALRRANHGRCAGGGGKAA